MFPTASLGAECDGQGTSTVLQRLYQVLASCPALSLLGARRIPGRSGWGQTLSWGHPP